MKKEREKQLSTEETLKTVKERLHSLETHLRMMIMCTTIEGFTYTNQDIQNLSVAMLRELDNAYQAIPGYGKTRV